MEARLPTASTLSRRPSRTRYH